MVTSRATRLLLAVLLLSATTPSHADDFTPFLVGGTPPAIGDFPAHVGLNIQPGTFCGGTILNQNHILTSGSCVLDTGNNLRAAGSFQVSIGIITIDVTTPTFTVIRVFVHPHYSPFSFENDIAVLRTGANINFPEVATPHVAPVELIDRIVPENGACQVVGWNWMPGTPTTVLQQLPVTVYPRQACNADTMFRGMVRESMMCVATGTAAQGMCVSNRGGGVYCNGRLAGVASFGFGCAQNATATVFTQVRFHRQWIEQQFTRNDNPQAGPTPRPGIDGASGLTQSIAAAFFATVLIIFMR